MGAHTGAPVTEELIASISDQLSEHMQRLTDAVDDVESQIRNGEVPDERLELAVERSAAGVIAAVGALRALAEVEAPDDEE
jgi:Mg2+ and Co2+ transporter CorA